jgi:hypothetical protein
LTASSASTSQRCARAIEQRASSRFIAETIAPPKIADVSGSATSEVASGLTIVNGRNVSVVSGGKTKPIAASFGGSLCHTR